MKLVTRPHFANVVGMVLIFTTVLSFIGVVGSNHTRSVQAQQAIDKPSYANNELLVKFKTSAVPSVREGNPANTGLPTLDNIFKMKKAKAFIRLAKPGKKSQTKADIFNWYKVTLNPQAVQVKIAKDGKTINVALEELKLLLRSDPNIQAVEENFIASHTVTPNDPFYNSTGSWGQAYGDMWGLKRINTEAAWASTSGNNNVTIANIDTGIDLTHPDISDNIWSNSGEIAGNKIDDDSNGYIDDKHGWNWVNNTPNPADDNGHGTHTAGTIAAVGNNNTGITGVAWSSKIMSLKFLNSNGNGFVDNGAQALIYAADMGAQISSNSWGCMCRSQVVDDAVRYEHDANMVTVAAAGNSYKSNALDFTPAGSDGVITVGATDSTDALASFSNNGERIDTVAPGVDILSLKASIGPVCSADKVVETNYCRLSGTSMAAPHVSGVAALILSRNPNLSGEEIRQLLRSSAVDLGSTGKDSTFGYGLINAEPAVIRATNPPPTGYISSPVSRTPLGSNPIEIIGSVGGNNFASYKVELGLGRSPSSMVQLASGNIPIQNGLLASFNPLNFGDGNYTVRVSVVDTNGKSYTHEVYDLGIDNVETSITSPFNIMPISNQMNIMGSVLAKNNLELANYTFDYGVGDNPTSYSSSGITLTTGGTVPISNNVLAKWDTSALVDGQVYTLRLTVTLSNGSRTQSTVKLGANKYLVNGWPKAVSADGSVCAGLALCEGTPAMADLDGNNTKELVIASPGSNKIFAYHKDGSTVAGFPVTVASGDKFKWPVVIDDVDSDGQPEIIATASTPDGNARVYMVRANGTPVASWPNPSFSANGLSNISDITPSIADLDGDGQKELVSYEIYWPPSGSVVHQLHALHIDGTEIEGFPKSIPVEHSFMQYPITIADLDRDNKPEIAFGNYDKFYLFDNKGNLLPGWPFTSTPINGDVETFQSTPAVGDIDGDGNLEVFSNATPNGALFTQLPIYGWKKDGTLLPGWPQMSGQYGSVFAGWPLNNPATADINNDGKDEVVVGFNNLTIHTLTSKLPLSPIVGNGPVTIGDANGGDLKISAGRRNFEEGVALANSNGTSYWQDNNITIGGFYDPFVLADMDNNGRLEYSAVLSVPNQPISYVYLWEIPGNGSWPTDMWPMYGHDAARTNHFSRGSRITDDKTPPTINITTPSHGSTVKDTVSINSSASDNVGVTKVEFYIDGQLKATRNDSPYIYSWNTKLVANGTHSITAKAYDVANLTSSASATVTVSNIDTTPPTVNVTYPLPNALLPRNTTITMTANASDDFAVAKVEFYINGALKCTDLTAAYTCSFKTMPKAGTSTFYAKAYDAAGHSTSSTTITAAVK